MRILAAVCALAGTLLAADPDVSGPRTGFVAIAESIRPVVGIPGSARLGDAVLVLSQRAALSSPAGVALDCADGEIREVHINTGMREVVASVSTCPDAIALSPDAQAAVLAFRAENAVRVIKDRELSEHIEMPGVIGCIISDDAGMLLCRTDAGTIARNSDGSSMRLLAEHAPAAFLRGSREALIADGARVYILRGGWELEPLADFDAASSLAILGNTVVVVASKANQKIATVHLQTRSVEVFDSPVEPEALVPLSSGVVHIASSVSGPVWLLVNRDDSTRLFFVPQPEAGND